MGKATCFAVDYPNFLTLPFIKRNVTFYNGWYYLFNESNHFGIDYKLSFEPVLAAADGVVDKIYFNDEQYDTFPTGSDAGTKAYGNHIIIDHGNEFKTIYAHLKSIDVKKDDKILRGQMIGLSGHTGYSTAPHLHFEVRGPSGGGSLGNGYYKYDPYGIYKIDVNLYLNNDIDDALMLWTTNPPSYSYDNILGFYSDGFHHDGTSQAFVNAYNKNNPKIGLPNDNGGGLYVHYWAGEQNYSYRVYVQDYLGVMSADHFGLDGKSIIILNDYFTPYKAYIVKEGFYGYYKTNDGPYSLGMPFTDEISNPYANSPYNNQSDPIQASTNVNDKITIQKFMRVFRNDSGDFVYENERKTLIWKNGISVQHFGVGEFSIDPETCSGVCPKAGDQMFVAIDNNPAHDMAWPITGQTVPTGIWFTKPGTYNFVMHNDDGTRKSGWGIIAIIREGNQQSGGGNGGYVFQRSTIFQNLLNNSPGGKSNDFHPEDNKVGIWLELSDVYEVLNVAWKWYKPNGEIYGECEYSSDSPTTYWKDFNSWRFLDVSGLTDDFGTWKVEIYINHNKVSTDYFTITAGDSGNGGNGGSTGGGNTGPETGPNGYTYSSNAVAAKDIIDGAEQWSLVPVGASAVFEQGQTIKAFVELKNIKVNHRFKIELYINDVFQWGWADSPALKDVHENDGWGWPYSYFIPTLGTNAAAGRYQAKIYMETENSSGFQLLDTISFEVRRTVPLNAFPYQEDFDDSAHNFWLDDYSDGKTAQMQIEAGTGINGSNSLKIDNSHAQANPYKIFLKIVGFPLKSNQEYRLSFYTKSSTPTDKILVSLGDDVADHLEGLEPIYSYLGLYQELHVDQDWPSRPYVLSFTTPDNIERFQNNARLAFYLGEFSGSLWIDNIELEEISLPPDPILRNRTFEASPIYHDGWKTEISNGAVGSISLASEGCQEGNSCIEVDNTTPLENREPYKIQLKQSDIRVFPGRLAGSVWLKQAGGNSDPCSIGVILQQTVPDWHHISDQISIAITPEWQKYNFFLNVMNPAYNPQNKAERDSEITPAKDIKIAFMFGSCPGKILMDDISISQENYSLDVLEVINRILVDNPKFKDGFDLDGNGQVNLIDMIYLMRKNSSPPNN